MNKKNPLYRDNAKPLEIKQEKYAVVLSWTSKTNRIWSNTFMIKANDRFDALEKAKKEAKGRKDPAEVFWFEDVIGISQLENKEK